MLIQYLHPINGNIMYILSYGYWLIVSINWHYHEHIAMGTAILGVPKNAKL